MTPRLERSGSTLLLAIAFLAMVIGGVVNLVLDAPESWLSPHPIFELTTIVFSLGLAIYLLYGWRTASRALARTRAELREKREERDAWRRSARAALDGLAEAIDAQFRRWDLTPAEREVALLLVKGYSHKRIAQLTGRSERTARQHAGAVYRKADLSGRAELAAFFLEDLMLPVGVGTSDATRPASADGTAVAVGAGTDPPGGGGAPSDALVTR
jgi:DNA-binding CsgD family transcriptional regulator